MTHPRSTRPAEQAAEQMREELEALQADTRAPLERLTRAAEGVREAGAKLKRTASDSNLRAVRPDADATARTRRADPRREPT